MANLSQQKRERMLAFLDTLKREHTDDDKVLRAIGEIENELNSKKYGLVWEQHEEAVDVKMKDYIPVFTEDHSKEITSDESGQYNFLLEGDNLHCLKLLEKTHKGKIDVIYIDPPYNTGKKDFIYNDRIIANDDTFRHSKWLSFMSSRLRSARVLLKMSGIIFISIDDHEQANLKLLCDEIFGENNFVALLTVENNPKGRKNSDFVSISSEYLLIYAKNKLCSKFIENIPKDVRDLAQDEDGNYVHNSGKRVLVGENDFNDNVDDFSSEKHYTVYYRKSDRDMKIVKETSVDAINTKLISEGYERYYSYNNNGFVLNTYTAEKLNELYEKEALDFKNGKIYEKNFSTSVRIKSIISNRKYKAVVDNKKVNFEIDVKTTSAKSELKNIFGVEKSPFSNPKNTGLIKLILTLIENKNITVLDFFAGSGTTAQAMLEQNREDGGNRRFILCTNNENNICESVTYPRVKTVITGIRPNGSKYSDGIPANLKYYKTDFIAKDTEYLSDALLRHIAEMIQLENGIKLDGKRYLMILTDEQADDISSHWDQYPDVSAIYLSKNVLLTTEQESLFENIPVYIIPDYYFDFELREEGESW
jgi:adenine-specific DNA-methyltransferase